jgi:MFS family permease
VFQQVLLSSLLIGIVFFQMGTTFGLYVTGIGFTATVYGGILSVNGALVVLCELPLTTVTRKFPARRVMALGYLLIAVGFGLNSVARTVPALVGCIAIFTFGEMLMMPVSAAYMADLSPPTMRGRYTGAYGMTWAVAMTLGPAMGMTLFAVGPMALWLGCAMSGLLAAGVISKSVSREGASARANAKGGEGIELKVKN